jgi:hypothetical protein
MPLSAAKVLDDATGRLGAIEASSCAAVGNIGGDKTSPGIVLYRYRVVDYQRPRDANPSLDFWSNGESGSGWLDIRYPISVCSPASSMDSVAVDHGFHRAL